MENWLLDLLCCPESHQPLRLGTAAEVERLNASIASGKARTRGGETPSQSVHGLLIRQDEAWGYVIRDEIPVLLVDQAVALGE
jgi:uncharacterized protein YbaR (Trm112 family)